MSRLTAKKLERWQKELATLSLRLHKLLHEAENTKRSAMGGRLSLCQALVRELNAMGLALAAADVQCELLSRHEAAKRS